MSPNWSAWHYTEGNGFFTACGSSVVPFAVDGSPMEREVSGVRCRLCLAKMRKAGLALVN